MWNLKQTTQFRKDYKKVQHNLARLRKLERVLTYLETTGTVPPSYEPHWLLGQYKGYMECHVENDFLLIWVDEDEKTICLVRLGSHSELFKK